MTDRITKDDYGPYNAFWCREFLPIERTIAKLASSGNRYREFLVAKMGTVASTMWLVKPEDGFVNDLHTDFFNASYLANSNEGAGAGIGHRLYADGKVYYAYGDPSRSWYGRTVPRKPTRSAKNSIQPFVGLETSGFDLARGHFEEWFCSGAAFLDVWDREDVAEQVHRIDRKYEAGRKTSMAFGTLRAQYPGWRPDDGSTPDLGEL